MATNYDDFINAGLLSPNAEREAALMGLFALGSQIGNRSAPRLSPTPPPMDLNAVMNVYQNQMNAALRRGAMRKKMQDQEKLRKLFTPQPVNENLAREIAQPVVDRYMAQPIMDDPAGLYTDTDLEQVEKRAMESVLPGARQMTTTPEALQGLPTNLARVIGGIGQVNPELGAKTLANAIMKQQKGQGSQANLLKYSDDIMDNQGNYIGIRRMDPETNSIVVDVGNGKTIPFDPSKHRPVNKSAFQRGVLSARNMMSLTEDVISTENSLRNLDSYMRTQEDTNTGFRRLVDQFTANLKTFFQKNPQLTKAEVSRLVAEGELQGLIGAFRIETVGGGVMTEQDAIRVLKNLGGDVNPLQNPEVLRRQIERLLRNKRRRYESLLSQYNNQVNRFYNQEGYEIKTPLGIGQNLQSARGTSQRSMQNQGRPIPADILQDAKIAVEKGAIPAEVIQRLQERGFDTSGINLQPRRAR